MRKKFVPIMVALSLLANLCGCATATTSSSPAPTVSATSEVAAENSTTGAPAAELAGESVRNTQANQDERGDLDFDEETDTDASAGRARRSRFRRRNRYRRVRWSKRRGRKPVRRPASGKSRTGT